MHKNSSTCVLQTATWQHSDRDARSLWDLSEVGINKGRVIHLNSGKVERVPTHQCDGWAEEEMSTDGCALAPVYLAGVPSPPQLTEPSLDTEGALDLMAHRGPPGSDTASGRNNTISTAGFRELGHTDKSEDARTLSMWRSSVTGDSQKVTLEWPDLHSDEEGKQAALEPLKVLPLWNVSFTMECLFPSLFEIVVRMPNWRIFLSPDMSRFENLEANFRGKKFFFN